MTLGRVVALALLASVSVTGCRSSGPRPVNDPAVPASARSWAEGPVRWLFRREDRRRFQKVRTTPQALAFIESFWQQRDPNLEAPGNRFAEEFFRRSQEADQLYGEDDRVGSLTDRGRVYILLGPPSRIAVTQRAAPALGAAARRARGERTTARVAVEIWGYVEADLGPELWARLTVDRQPVQPVRRIEVAFVSENRRTRLISGEEHLDVAVGEAVRRP